MAQLTTHQRKVRVLEKQVEGLRALLIFSRQYNDERRRDLDSLVEGARSLTNRQLDETAAAVARDVAKLMETLEATQPLEFYVRYAAKTREALGPAQFAYLTRWQLRQFFKNIEELHIGLDTLPEHTRLSIDVHGVLRAGQPGEYRIIEAALFEDMCAAFNRAWALAPELTKPGVPKAVIKECVAMRRAAVLAAFYFVESYLNSIAFDYLVQRNVVMPASDWEKIIEWDQEKDRQQLLNFRDKLLGYPRIILGLKHPPLQENNCPEIAFLLEEAKAFRDAIVHANPRPHPLTLAPEKELRFWRIASPGEMATPLSPGSPANQSDGIPDWIKAVDCAICVVEKIETLIHGDTKRLFWLQRRSSEGPFPLSVFN